MLSYWAWICLVEADYVLKVYISYMAVTLALDRSCRRSLRGWRSDVGTLALDRSHKTSLALNQKVVQKFVVGLVDGVLGVRVRARACRCQNICEWL